MEILVLNGSPRTNGNTAKMVEAFCQGAQSAGHRVTIVHVCTKQIGGCRGCEYCHRKGHGECVQKDDMQEVYEALKTANMLVLASPIYYHGISGQLKCVIDRFYASIYPSAPRSLKKIAMFLSSGAPNQYESAIYEYKGNFTDYLGLKNEGVFAVPGSVSQQKLKELEAFGAALKE